MLLDEDELVVEAVDGSAVFQGPRRPADFAPTFR